ncbi:hypothetical protein [Streptomyces sp. NPDC018947]|uniref:TRADD-N-associated membrane domain-containing protein n=1 Tax=Streptomyces sp. NPDC018947 TaxID=3365054 RepID=UPI0037B26F75
MTRRLSDLHRYQRNKRLPHRHHDEDKSLRVADLWKLALLGLSSTTLASIGVVAANSGSSTGLTDIQSILLVVFVTLALGSLFGVEFLRTRRDQAARAAQQKAEESAIDRLREKMELPSLIDLNRLMMDRYHDIATKQASKSFRWSLIAMGIALAAILGGASLALSKHSTPDRVLIGALAALGATLSGYLSKTYLSVYYRSLRQLNQYFNQPLLNSYFLSAQRLVEELPRGSDQRNALYAKIIDEILSSAMKMHDAAMPNLKETSE